MCLGGCRPAAQETSASPQAASVEAAEPLEAKADEPIRFEAGGAEFRVWVADGSRPPADLRPFVEWLRNSAQVVAQYYGAFPVPEMDITLAFNSGSRVGFGQHWDGRYIRVRVGRGSDQEELDTDWVMIHEMHHAAFPDLHRRHQWMQEGLSTYLEPVTRARAGQYDPERLWTHFYKRMPHGLPGFGDRGLDVTRTWGRLYWGGTLYWFLADVGIRKQTNNEKSLHDALVGIQAAGGDGRVDWSTEKVTAIGDEATGTTVLRDLYDELAKAPGEPDLERIFADLGVVEVAGDVELRDDAPLVEIRRAITQDGR